MVDAHGLHSFACKRAPGRSARHHALNDVIARAFASAATKGVWLKIEIHKIHKMNEIHLPKHRNPQHLGLYKIHSLKV